MRPQWKRTTVGSTRYAQLAKYTYTGDANIDGKIDVSDYGQASDSHAV